MVALLAVAQAEVVGVVGCPAQYNACVVTFAIVGLAARRRIINVAVLRPPFARDGGIQPVFHQRRADAAAQLLALAATGNSREVNALSIIWRTGYNIDHPNFGIAPVQR